MNTELTGKRAVVTAGAGGSGLVIAQGLAAEGAEVFVCDVDETAIGNLPESLTGSFVDVSDPDAVDAWLAPIVADGIDILINNAGIAGPTAAIEDITTEDWRRCLTIDLDSQFFCTRAVVPAMKKNGSGAIVNISSTTGLMGLPMRAPYVAAKFAIVGLTKTLAMELGRDNIRVNAIAPGSITGDRMERVIAAHATADGISEDRVRAMYTQGVSLASFVEPEEISDMVVYLCSARGRRITGQVIAVDGGTETLYPRELS
ncbi:SDR family oxidoreductase [Pelagibius sp. Alg239-R121]|uniref:SDR family oxidoreductase n=1 Tax=Pelagibius sp. Alg239-R121 TaxID=2993448 RepID=UPI0024A61124|nr:SDR family oxidoreductase [Pelagibius sp. Alg239-R121]